MIQHYIQPRLDPLIWVTVDQHCVARHPLLPNKVSIKTWFHFSGLTKCPDDYSSIYCWLVRGSLFIELGCPKDLGKGSRGDLGTFMISRPIKLKSDWLKFSIWNGVMGNSQSDFIMELGQNLVPTSCKHHANLMHTSCQPHANLMPTSCQPCANLVPTSCQPHANLMLTSCKPCANLIQTSCKPHASLTQTSCQPCANLMPTSC